MAKGFSGMPGNMGNLMKQAQKMQRQMAQTQEELKEKTLNISSGGGAVSVTITGKREITELRIDPEAAEDTEMLQDLIISAVNEAIRQMDAYIENEMSKVTGGMGLPPGLF